MSLCQKLGIIIAHLRIVSCIEDRTMGVSNEANEMDVECLHWRASLLNVSQVGTAAICCKELASSTKEAGVMLKNG